MTKQKFPSKYSNGKDVSAAQFITEMICEKKAKLDKKDLHYRFWVNKEWASFYRNQIATAYKLVKEFDPLGIIKALNSKPAEKIYSLRAPHLIDMIKKEIAVLDSQKKDFTLEVDRKENKTFSSNSSPKKKNIISLLKDIDYES